MRHRWRGLRNLPLGYRDRQGAVPFAGLPSRPHHLHRVYTASRAGVGRAGQYAALLVPGPDGGQAGHDLRSPLGRRESVWPQPGWPADRFRPGQDASAPVGTGGSDGRRLARVRGLGQLPEFRSALAGWATDADGRRPEGRLELWRTPDGRVRGHELMQLVPGEHSLATCAAFSPDGSFAVTASQDRVHVWPVPGPDVIDRQLTAEITLVEKAVESVAGQVRVWAELPNADGSLLPGTNVTVVVYPDR